MGFIFIFICNSLQKPMKGGPIDLSEVQDFSISKKSSSSASALGLNFSSGKGKLDDMLTKLMKKNNYVSDQQKQFLSLELD